MNQSVSFSDTVVLFLRNIRPASVTRAVLKKATSELTNVKEQNTEYGARSRQVQSYWYLNSGRLG
jgi:hypothetical protein